MWQVPVFAKAQHYLYGANEQSVSSWNATITNHVKYGQAKEALKVFQMMCYSGVISNTYTISITLSACITLENLQLGKKVHAIYVISVAEPSAYVNSTLINMYANCGSLEDAQNIYGRTADLDVVSCNAMITGYVKHGYMREAIELYKSICSSNLQPNDVTFTSTLNACAKLEDLESGKEIHKDILIVRGNSNMYIENTLIDVYSKCASVEDAWHMFQKMAERDAISWNAMIAAYSKRSWSKNAFMLFWQMQLEGIHPTDRTFVSIINACNSIEYLDQGKHLHALVEESEFQSNSIVCSTVIDMYTKCGSMASAMNLFERTSKSDVVIWNVILTANAKQGFMKETLEIYDRMKVEGVSPNKVTFLSICNVCGSLEASDRAKEIHACIVKIGIHSDLPLGNGLIDMYSKCKSLDDACHVFDNLSHRDVVSWTAIIAGYVQHELSEDALYLYNQMQWEGVFPNEVTFLALLNVVSSLGDPKKGRQLHCQMIVMGIKCDVAMSNTLIHMYGKCKSLVVAHEIFNETPKGDATTWNAIISLYAKCGYAQKAFKLFSQMKSEGVMANEVTFVSILDAFASEAAFEQGKQVHATIISVGLDSRVFVASALIDMYAKCGNLHCAHEVLNRLSTRDVGSWSALITAYAQHGHGKKTLELAAQMSREGIRLNHITLLSILSACSHAGLVSEGCFFFDTLSREHAIKLSVKHYACIVDLLGRAGRLEEAHKLIQKMQVKPTASLWMSLLSACRLYGNVELATHAAEKVHQLEPQSAAPFQLLFDMHASSAAGLAKAEQILQPGDA